MTSFMGLQLKHTHFLQKHSVHFYHTSLFMISGLTSSMHAVRIKYILSRGYIGMNFLLYLMSFPYWGFVLWVTTRLKLGVSYTWLCVCCKCCGLVAYFTEYMHSVFVLCYCYLLYILRVLDCKCVQKEWFYIVANWPPKPHKQDHLKAIN